MKGIALTHSGFEAISEKEVKELIKSKKTEIKETVVLFDFKNHEDLCLLCYKGQSFVRVLYFLDETNIKNIEKTKIDLDEWIEKDTTFAVKCLKEQNEEFSTKEIEEKVADAVLKKYKLKVDLENPDLVVFAYVFKNKCYIGIDFSGFDLGKRNYKVFSHPSSLKGTVAYSVVRISGYDSKKLIVDPFCGSGIILIEAALFASGFPVNYFYKDKFCFQKLKPLKDIDFEKFFKKIDDKIDVKQKTTIYGYDAFLGSVKSSQKNAKIAGINKKVAISRADIEWLETKCDKETVNLIVTEPPFASKNVDINIIRKIYTEFFYQAEFVLKKKGRVAVITTPQSAPLLKECAEKYKFSVAEELTAWNKKQEFKIIVFVIA